MNNNKGFELLYIYLDNYLNFKKQSFCFSSEYQFNTYVKSSNIKIEIKKNPKYIPNFFENNNITNVTAVIGKNGAGKSNILDFIKSSLPSGAGGFSEECIIAFRNTEGNLKIHYTKSLKVSIDDKTKQFETYTFDNVDTNLPFYVKSQIDDFHNVTFIHYSNIVDLKIPTNLTYTKFRGEEEVMQVDGFKNISTMSLLAQDQENFSNDRKLKVDKVDAYKSREISRNIEFIVSKHKDLLNFDLPEHIIFYPLDTDEKALIDIKEYQWTFDLINKYKSEFNLKQNNKKELVLNRILRSLFFNLIRQDINHKIIKIEYKDIAEIQEETFLEYILSIVKIFKKGKFEGYNADFLKEKADNITNFINFVKDLINNTEEKFFLTDDYYLRVPLNEENKNNANEFVKLYIHTKDITDFINFRFRGLSSGEQSMLTMVSRFYKILNDYGYNDLNKSFIILIDEGDIYFHPEWQRRFLHDLLNYIPKIFKDKKIQFILTANTPYLASDLPKSNVIFIDKTEKSSIVLNPDNNKKETFAANIHTLLSDSYFVSNFLGEFAKLKIEKLIRFLNNHHKEKLFTKETAYKHIMIIGESIIRERLLDMYNEVYPEKIKSIKDRKKELEKELNDINDELKSLEKND